MIIPKDRPQNEQGTENRAERFGAFELRRYSQEGGLTQFGAYVETLHPGSRTGERHWHEAEDDCAMSSTTPISSRSSTTRGKSGGSFAPTGRC